MLGVRAAQEVDRKVSLLLPLLLVVFATLLNACGGNSAEQAPAAGNSGGSGGGGGGSDTTPPSQPASFTATAAGSTGASLSWDASTDDVAVTGYIVSRDGNQIATPATTSFVDTGLSAATTYNYTVVARDAAGNVSIPASTSVTTAPSGGDTTPPSEPANFTAMAAGSTAANLSWNASTDDVAVTGYVVSRDGSQIASLVSTTFVDTGLSAATTYSYTVVARDAAGNTSIPASASVTTATAPPPYYVATTGSDSNSCAAAASPLTPKKTIQAALGCLTPGGTLIIRDGAYAAPANALTNLPSGAPGNYITIRAENEGSVTITGAVNVPTLDMVHTNAYLIIQGLRFHDPETHYIVGNHLKFLRNEFKGGCDSGNCSNTGVGTNDFNDTADILLEDNWWHGSGGRYNLLIYNANRVVVRRGVIRHDGGWTDNGSDDPEAGLNFYNSSDCSAQNVLVIDSDLTYHTWQGAFYSVYNGSSPGATLNNSWYGNIALNSLGSGFILDGNGSITGAVVKDMVMWDTEATAAMGSPNLSVINVAVDRVTSGTSKFTGTSYGFVQFAGTYSGTVTNAIVANTIDDAIGVPMTYFDSFNNGSTSSGTGRVTYSPFDNGLKYLVRIEGESSLETAGSGGGQIGARIVTRIGTPGTLQGETGWNIDTGVALWPYPNEARIKKEMCADTGITRGFCTDTSLTNYIMNYLGNGNPYP